MIGERTVWTFYYGSNINLEILKRFDYVPDRVEVARLPGFDITIRPLANLVPSERHCVYGILATGRMTTSTVSMAATCRTS